MLGSTEALQLVIAQPFIAVCAFWGIATWMFVRWWLSLDVDKMYKLCVHWDGELGRVCVMCTLVAVLEKSSRPPS